MKGILFHLGMGGVALFLLCSILGSQTSANSTSGAPMTMCMDCHGVPKGADLHTQNLPSSFQPGATYEISIKVSSAVKSEGDIQGGFAVSASAGELSVSDSKNTMKSDGYITHTAEGALFRSWSFKWKAPSERKKVSLVISVIAANGDFAPANDGFARKEFILQPK